MKAWGDRNILKKMEDVEKKEKDKEKELKEKKELSDKLKAEAKKAFIEKYRTDPCGYIRRAIVAASDTAAFRNTGRDGGYIGRSPDGKRHTENGPAKDSPHPSVQRYHALEEQGKKCAKAGDIDGAIKYYDEAAAARLAYEKEYSKDPDKGHDDAVIILRQRSSSLTNLRVNLQDKDPGVVAARLLVNQFYANFKLPPPPC